MTLANILVVLIKAGRTPDRICAFLYLWADYPTAGNAPVTIPT
ncbi:hypothetical protein FORC066_1471 [Yersinia enterocolitica]|nr:hypothetical protein FORC066_1471 [Yersinia enterocolitica]